MPTINQLPTVTQVSGGDQFPLYVTSQGDARRCSVTTMLAYFQDNFSITQSDRFILGPGSASAPSLTFANDLNTGIYSPAPDTVAVATAGVGRVVVTDVGDVGVGTETPNTYADTTTVTIEGSDFAELDFKNSNGDAGYIFADRIGTTGSLGYQAAGSTSIHKWFNGASESMRLVGGTLAIGTSTPDAAAQLDIASTTRGFLPPRMTEAERDLIATPPDGLILYNTTADKLQVRAAGSWVNLH
jgi:hypothetical protein